MKRISLVFAFAVAFLSVSAESFTINHTTAGGLAAELKTALGVAGDADDATIKTAMARVTDLTIIGTAAMNATDFAAIRTHLRPSLKTLDLSQAVFTNNKLPGGDYDKQGILQTMNVTSVKLPETLTALSGGAFYMCKSLVSVNLPDGITSINQYCFSGCEKLQLDALPPSLTNISSDAFRGCSSLQLTHLPETIKTIGGDAFNDNETGTKVPAPGIAFTKLPAALKKLGERAFRKTGCTFSEWPEGLTAIPANAFSASKVQFTELSPNITSVGAYAFQSVKTMTEFTIPNQANLWTKIPDGCFFVQTDDVKRTFICRAPSAPKATVNIGSGAWTGSFSQVAKNPNTTFKVLASALESFKTTAPYSTMNLEVLTAPVTIDHELVDVDAADNINVEHEIVVAGKSHKEFTANAAGSSFSGTVYEGDGTYNITFPDSETSLYVSKISLVPAESAAADDNFIAADGEDGATDSNLLYTTDGKSLDELKALRAQPVSIPVNVGPANNRLKVTLSNYFVVAGVDTPAAAPANAFTRNGDTIYLTTPGATLYNMQGVAVATTAANTLSLSELPAGVYLLRTSTTTAKLAK